MTFDSSAQTQECILRSLAKRNSAERVYNPWGNMTPLALIQILSESDRNLLLFTRIVEQIIRCEFVSTRNIAEIINIAWEIHLKKDISSHEWYILKNLPLYPSRDDLKEVCNRIPKTEFEHLFKNLFRRGMITKSRSYDRNGKKCIKYHLRSKILEYSEAIL